MKDADVVLGTHGRGFWILDDIEPLRDLSPATYTKPVTVFEPDQPAIRGVGNAVIQYFLAEKPEKLTVEILDGSGTVVDTFEGTEEVKKVERNFLEHAEPDHAHHDRGVESIRVEPPLQGRDEVRRDDHLERRAGARPQSASGPLPGAGDRGRSRARPRVSRW